MSGSTSKFMQTNVQAVTCTVLCVAKRSGVSAMATMTAAAAFRTKFRSTIAPRLSMPGNASVTGKGIPSSAKGTKAPWSHWLSVNRYIRSYKLFSTRQLEQSEIKIEYIRSPTIMAGNLPTTKAWPRTWKPGYTLLIRMPLGGVV